MGVGPGGGGAWTETNHRTMVARHPETSLPAPGTRPLGGFFSMDARSTGGAEGPGRSGASPVTCHLGSFSRGRRDTSP